MAPSASPELVKRIQKAAGKRLGHEVEPRWDIVQQRWVILTFDKNTGRVDFPWIVVCNPDGTYRPLDDRVIDMIEGSKCDIEKANKKRRRKWQREDKKSRRTMMLIKRWGALRDVREKRLQYCEESPKLDKLIGDTEEELIELHGGLDDDVCESAQKLVRLLKERNPVAAGEKLFGKDKTLWTPGC